MTLAQIKSFVQLVESENFTQAAELLFTTQSTLSKYMKALEKELGVQLLIRKSRSIELTAEGRYFLDFAETVNKNYILLQQKLNKKNRNQVVMITIPASLWRFSSVVDEFITKHPEIDIVLHEREQDEALKAAGEMGADIILTWDNTVPNEGYDIIPIMPSLLCIGVGKKDPLASVGMISLHELKDQPFIMLHQPIVRNYLLRTCREAGFVPNVQHHVTTTDTMLRFIREGKGVAFVYKAQNEKKPSYLKDIHIIYLKEHIMSSMSLVLPSGKISDSTKVFINFVKENFN